MSASVTSVVSFGPFELGDEIGRGAMGVVYRATHRPDGRPVAIKVLAPERLKKQGIHGSFKDEVRAVAGLDHPAIVSIYDYGTIPFALPDPALVAGSPFMVMELVDGGTLHPHRGRLPWRDVYTVLLALLDALAHAHARGVIHRDLKLGNVLVGNGRVKVTDFGLAHALRDPVRGGEGAVGTPAFMAPEQFEGSHRDFGPWTDMYSFGCLAWTLVTGEAPYGEELVGAMTGHLSRPLPPFRSFTPVPDGFQPFLLRLLEKNPWRRFQRAADAAWQLVGLGPGTGEESTLFRDMTTGRPFGASTFASDQALTLAIPTRNPGVEGPVHPLVRPPVAPFLRPKRRHHAVFLHSGLGLVGLRSVPFVGRDEICERLWAQLSAAIEKRENRFVVLSGAAGVGKTRVAEWITERAHEVGAASVLRAQHSASSGSGDGLAPMFLRQFHGVGLDRVELAERLVRWGGMAKPMASRAAEVLVPRGAHGDASAGPDERFAAFLQLMLGMQSERPLVLWIDDAQWAAEALRFVEHVAEGPSQPCLTIVGVRDDALVDRPDEAAAVRALAADPRTLVIPVGPLEPARWSELTDAVLPLAPDLAVQIERRAAGNPLFFLQMVDDLMAARELVPAGSGYMLRSGATLHLPDSVHEVWSRRLSQILDPRPADWRRALELAAVLGLMVEWTTWRAACLALEIEAPRALVTELVEWELATLQEDTWSFAHGMLRETLDRSARSGGRMKHYQRACAGALLGKDDSASVERRVLHLVEAEQWEEALEAMPRIVRWRLLSGDTREAEVILRAWNKAVRALGLDESDARVVEGWVGWARLFHARSDLVASDEWAHQAEAAARQHGPLRLRAEAVLMLGWNARLRGDDFKGWRLLRGAEDLAAQAGDVRTRVDAWIEIGFALCDRGRNDDATVEFTRVLAEPGVHPLGRAGALRGLGLIAAQDGDFDLARASFCEAQALYRGQGSRWGEYVVLIDLGNVDLRRARADLAEKEYLGAIALLDVVRVGETLIPWLNLTQLRIDAGALPEAREALEGARAALDRSRDRQLAPALELCEAYLALEEGRLDAWDRTYEKAVLDAEATGFYAAEFLALLNRAIRLLTKRKDTERAATVRAIADRQRQVLGERAAR